MKKFKIISAIATVLTIGMLCSCSKSSAKISSNLQYPIGKNCGVQADNSAFPFGRQEGILLAVSDEWVVLLEESGQEDWIPRENVTLIVVLPESAENSEDG